MLVIGEGYIFFAILVKISGKVFSLFRMLWYGVVFAVNVEKMKNRYYVFQGDDR